MQYVFFLGSHATLSAAECFTVLTRRNYSPRVIIAHEQYLVVELTQPLPDNFLQQLGGSHRIGRVIGQQDHEWKCEEILKVLYPLPRKLRLGIASRKMGLALKKAVRKQNVRLQFISPMGQKLELNTAQVIFNRLHVKPNMELMFLKNKGTGAYYLAKTEQVQDIQAYEGRDTGRPARDARVGMLPPKLAQIMLNLIPSFPVQPPVILDPFCGTGTILQEGWLMGYEMIGSDVSERMVRAAEENLAWVTQISAASSTPGESKVTPGVFPAASVTQHDIRQPFERRLNNRVDAIVTEPYLGKPLTSPLARAEAEKRLTDLSELYLAFFKQAAKVLKDGAYVVFALPALRTAAGDWLLSPTCLLDDIIGFGYSLEQLVPNVLRQYYQATERDKLIYARPDALVGREITLWHIRKPEGQLS